MSKRVHIELYHPDYYDQLDELLKECSQELFGCGTSDTLSFINNHYAVYLAIFEDEVVGVSAYLINEYFGLRPATVGNSYIYIKPQFRRTRAMYLFAIQSTRVCAHLGMDLEHYYETEESRRFGDRQLGESTPLYTTFVYNCKSVMQVGERLASKLTLKD